MESHESIVKFYEFALDIFHLKSSQFTSIESTRLNMLTDKINQMHIAFHFKDKDSKYVETS